MILYCNVYVLQINSSTCTILHMSVLCVFQSCFHDGSNSECIASRMGRPMVLPLFGNTKILYSISFQPYEQNVGIILCVILSST